MVGHACGAGVLDRETGERWLAEQRDRTDAGTFLARWDKILVVAHRMRASSFAESPKAQRLLGVVRLDGFRGPEADGR